MSGGGGSRASGGAAVVPIPPGSKKLVAELKAIVDFPESEIYAMLRECNMDPNEAVHRLLSQDTFHEVKSKKDKKKEIKEPADSRFRAVNSSSARGTKTGTERAGRNIASQSSYVDYGGARGKPQKKKENGTGSSLLDSNVVASNLTQKSIIPNNPASMETKMHPPSVSDGLYPSLQPSSGFQNNWLGKPGHVSMADIVKMGRPQAKPSGLPIMASERSFVLQDAAPQLVANKSPATIQAPETDKNTYSQEPISHISEISHEFGIAEGQHDSYDGWTLIDEPSAASGSTMIDKYEVPVDCSEPAHFTSSNLAADGISSHIISHFQDMQSLEDDCDGASLPVEARPVSISDRQIQVDTFPDALMNDNLLNSANSYVSPQQKFEPHEGSFPVDDVGVASAATEFQNLSLHEEVTSKKSIDANPAVIIPDHLQVTNADCAHLSFGSFESGTFAGTFPSKPFKSIEVANVTDSSSSIEQSDARNEYYNSEQLSSTLTGNITSRTDNDTEILETPPASEPELTRNDPLDTQYSVPSVSSYTASNTIQTNLGAYMYTQGNAQMQNISPYSSLMQPNSLQSNLLAPSLTPFRDLDLSFSPLLTAQAPAKYNAAAPSISGSGSSLQEAVNPGVFANPQSSQQNLPSTSTSSTASALPQQPPLHHYSQPALPLSHFANMLSYPFLPQSYTYLPSAGFQQPYAANGPFHQSPAGLPNTNMKYLLPQYKTNASMANLPQSGTVASVYGGFGNSTITPGSFNLNPAGPSASASSPIGFDEALAMQYKEASQYMTLQQQTENPAMWGHDAGSRTMSALPGSTLHNYHGQSQQNTLRQSQQSSQFGNLGYPNFYQSQAGASQEHQQNPSEGNLNGSQNTQAQPTHHIWQHSY